MTFKESIAQYCLRHNVARIDVRAALIDMDGTLYDSMPHHAAAWVRMMEEEGCHISEEDIYINEGMTGVATVDLLFNRQFGHGTTPEHASALYARKAGYFAEMPPVKQIAGASEMINGFIAHGVTTVLVTGSAQNTTLSRLDDDFPGAFPAERRITALDVSHGKPHPEPYIKAMALVGVTPEQAVVVDNAPLGVKAGAASEAFTIGVTTGPIPPQALYDAGADYVFESMHELVEHLNDLF